MDFFRIQLINNHEFRQCCDQIGLGEEFFLQMTELMNGSGEIKKITWELLERRFERRGLNLQRFLAFEREEI